MCALDAAIGPQHLGDAVELGRLARQAPFVLRGEALVPWWMPVLAGDDKVKSSRRLVGDCDDLVASGHRQGPSQHEVVLEVNQNQAVHGVCLD